MAVDSGKLTAVAVKSARPGKHFDGGGLFLLVKQNGAKLWRMKYRFAGKEKLVSFGPFPTVSIAEARQRRDAARLYLRNGNDPSALKQQRRSEAQDASQNTFASVASDRMARQQVAEITANKDCWLLESFLFPHIGNRPIAAITPKELLSVLRKVEASGKLETASRAKNKAGQVFRFAVLEGKAEIDPTASLRGALKSPVVKHHASVSDPKAIGELLRAIHGFEGQVVTASALKIAPLVFDRPRLLQRLGRTGTCREPRLRAIAQAAAMGCCSQADGHLVKAPDSVRG